MLIFSCVQEALPMEPCTAGNICKSSVLWTLGQKAILGLGIIKQNKTKTASKKKEKNWKIFQPTHCLHVVSCRLSPCLTCLGQFPGESLAQTQAIHQQNTNTVHFVVDALNPVTSLVFVWIIIRIFYSYYETKAVILAMGITALVCIAVTIFCFQTKVEGDVNSVSCVTGCLCCQFEKAPLSHITMGALSSFKYSSTFWDTICNRLLCLMQLEINK